MIVHNNVSVNTAVQFLVSCPLENEMFAQKNTVAVKSNTATHAVFSRDYLRIASASGQRNPSSPLW